MSRILILTGILAACATVCPVAAQTTIVPVDVLGAYLHVDPVDLTNPAVPISLGALGLVPGYTIELECSGDWSAASGSDVQTTLIAVFSGDPTLLGTTLLHRVPGAIDAGVDNFSGGTWPGNEPTEIPEDFTVGRPGISIIIPAGAKFLFVTPADIYYRDNSDPDHDLGIKITLLSTVSVPDGGPADRRLELSARPNPFAAESSIAFQLAEPASVRLLVHDPAGRLLRTLVTDRLEAGSHVARWDGRDDSGRPASAGTYFASLRSGGHVGTTRLVLVR